MNFHVGIYAPVVVDTQNIISVHGVIVGLNYPNKYLDIAKFSQENLLAIINSFMD